MKLAKDLVIEDDYVVRTLQAMPFFGFTDNWKLTSSTRKIDGHWILCKGTELPTGPLHPIAQQAFAMAGFVLVDSHGYQFVWHNNNWRRRLYDITNGHLPSSFATDAPTNARIHSHTDPTLIVQ